MAEGSGRGVTGTVPNLRRATSGAAFGVIRWLRNGRNWDGKPAKPDRNVVAGCGGVALG